MPVSYSNPIAGALGVCLLPVPLFCLGWRRPQFPGPAAMRRVIPAPPATPSEAVRREARRYWIRAEQAVNRERELLEAWDPATEDLNQEKWRQQLMAARRNGDPTRAPNLPHPPTALARPP